MKKQPQPTTVKAVPPAQNGKCGVCSEKKDLYYIDPEMAHGERFICADCGPHLISADIALSSANYARPPK